MPKMKTHRGAAKRFRKTGTGKIMRIQANVRHYLENKPGQKRRKLQRNTSVSKADTKRVNRMLGGGS